MLAEGLFSFVVSSSLKMKSLLLILLKQLVFFQKGLRFEGGNFEVLGRRLLRPDAKIPTQDDNVYAIR